MKKYVTGKIKDKVRTSRTLPILFYPIKVKSIKDLSSGVDIPLGYVGTNPAILNLDNEFIVCIRCISYKLANDNSTSSTIIDGDDWHTKNRFYLADKKWNKIKEFPHLNDIFEGVEDIRFFQEPGRILAVGSFYNTTTKNRTSD